jgi:DNA polymerase-3 subunit delta
MESRQAFRELREGKIRPFYVIFGTETYLMNEFVQRLTELVAEPDHRDMAVVRFDTSDTPLDAVIDEAETLPFLVPQKLVLVRDSTLLSSGKESAKIEHRPERLISYIKAPMESTVLVFVVPHEKLDERKKLVKTVKAADADVHFAPLSADDLQRWMVRRAETQGRRFEPDAAAELLRRVGADMHTLAAETDKLCLHAGADGVITARAVQELVPAALEQNVFRLAEELAAFQTEKALATLYDLLKQREEPIKLVALLVRQFRHMIFVKELDKQGYSPQKIAGHLGLHPYAVKITLEKARKYSESHLTKMLSELAELDYAMKTGQTDKALGLEMFLLRAGARGAGSSGWSIRS